MRSKLPYPRDHDTDRGAGRQPLAHRQVGQVVVDHQPRDLIVGQDLVCDTADVLPHAGVTGARRSARVRDRDHVFGGWCCCFVVIFGLHHSVHHVRVKKPPANDKTKHDAPKMSAGRRSARGGRGAGSEGTGVPLAGDRVSASQCPETAFSLQVPQCTPHLPLTTLYAWLRVGEKKDYRKEVSLPGAL